MSWRSPTMSVLFALMFTLATAGCSDSRTADDAAMGASVVDDETTTSDRRAGDTTATELATNPTSTPELSTAPAEEPKTVVTVRGTAERPTPTGYVRTPGGCQESTAERYTTGPVSLAIPASWTPGGGGTLGRSTTHGAIGYLVDGAWGPGSIDVTLLEPEVGTGYPNTGFQPWLSVGGEKVDTIEWDGEPVDVNLIDDTFNALLPVMTVTTTGGTPTYRVPAGQYRLAVSVRWFAGTTQPPPDVLTVLASTRVDLCLTENYYYENFGDFTLNVED